MSITLAVISGSKEDFESTHVIAERAAELKKYLKKFQGSNFLSERRGLREEPVGKAMTSQRLSSAR